MPRDAFAELREMMTNRESQKWTQAGSPGHRDRNIDKIKPFLAGDIEARLRSKRKQPGWRFSA